MAPIVYTPADCFPLAGHAFRYRVVVFGEKCVVALPAVFDAFPAVQRNPSGMARILHRQYGLWPGGTDYLFPVQIEKPFVLGLRYLLRLFGGSCAWINFGGVGKVAPEMAIGRPRCAMLRRVSLPDVHRSSGRAIGL